MNIDQLKKIDRQILDEIDNAATMLDTHLAEGNLFQALETHKHLMALDALRGFSTAWTSTLDLDPDNEPEPEIPENPDALTIGKVFGTPETTPLLPDPPNEALIGAKESYDQHVSSSEPTDGELVRQAILQDLAFLETLGFVRVG